jgi:hypothetical protein
MVRTEYAMPVDVGESQSTVIIVSLMSHLGCLGELSHLLVCLACQQQHLHGQGALVSWAGSHWSVGRGRICQLGGGAKVSWAGSHLSVGRGRICQLGGVEFVSWAGSNLSVESPPGVWPTANPHTWSKEAECATARAAAPLSQAFPRTSIGAKSLTPSLPFSPPCSPRPIEPSSRAASS